LGTIESCPILVFRPPDPNVLVVLLVADYLTETVTTLVHRRIHVHFGAAHLRDPSCTLFGEGEFGKLERGSPSNEARENFCTDVTALFELCPVPLKEFPEIATCKSVKLIVKMTCKLGDPGSEHVPDGIFDPVTLRLVCPDYKSSEMEMVWASASHRTAICSSSRVCCSL
jgi:hypothetical protein